ncbi:transposase [Lacticaseibacillus paracasei]|uniref:transposase n=1 Tax=Lacticaseibacillus paracasei TaxID=1597 RepID=UPI00145DA2CD
MTDYQHNITFDQFQLIRDDLETFRKRTCPRKVVLFDAFNEVFYILRTGAQWRQLSHDFPR